jgi:hypothetical protein
MSSATSTDAAAEPIRPAPDASTSHGLQPWQFFVLAALACATVVTFLVRGQGVATVILLSVVIGAAALVGMAMLRTVRPLVSATPDSVRVVGMRTRAALEREKMLALRAIKELEFDRSMGKVSEDDFHEMAGRLRARAARLIRQLDAGESYRQQIEREVAQRLAASGAAAAKAPPQCAACATANDVDAKFCKACGARL